MRAVRKTEPSPGQPAPRRVRRNAPKIAAADATPTESPALALQADLSARWEAEDEYAGPRWSPRRTLVVAGGLSLMLWVVIGLAVKGLVTG